MRKGLIYMIKFPNGKIYIGKTISSVNKRIRDHISEAKRGSRLKVHNAMKKYNYKIQISILEDSILESELSQKEIFYIAKYNSTKHNIGYNMTYGGEGVSSVCVSEETRKKQSTAKLGKKSPERNAEWRENISRSKKGSKNGMYNKVPVNKGIKFVDFVGKGLNSYIKNRRYLSKRLVLCNLEGEELLCFYSISDLAKFINMSKSNTSESVNKNRIIKNKYKTKVIKNEVCF